MYGVENAVVVEKTIVHFAMELANTSVKSVCSVVRDLIHRNADSAKGLDGMNCVVFNLPTD